MEQEGALCANWIANGFKRIESDPSVYIYSNGEVRIIVPTYIDDITLASKLPAAIDKYV